MSLFAIQYPSHIITCHFISFLITSHHITSHHVIHSPSFLTIPYYTGRWLVAALQTVQRSIVNAFPIENDENRSHENQKKQIKNSNLIETNIIRCDEVPYRVEADANLKNRKVVTQYDYSCVISENDFKRVSGNGLLLENNEISKTKSNVKNNKNNNNNKNNRSDDFDDRIKVKGDGSDNLKYENNDIKVTKKENNIISLSNIKNKLSIIKNTVLQQMSSQKTKIKTRFVWFDYHKKCKNGNIASLKEIFPTVKDAIFGVGGFYSFRNLESPSSMPSKNKKKNKNNENDENNKKLSVNNNNEKSDFVIMNVQKNIVRTNCIDCLDRTNVVQTTIGRWALNNQLRELGAEMGEVEKEGVWDTMSLPDEVRTLQSHYMLSYITSPLRNSHENSSSF
jgi:hypothetical protein